MSQNGKVILVVAQKGGTGKSTATYMTAQAMHRRGLKVALLDSDHRQLTCLDYITSRKAYALTDTFSEVDTTFPEVAPLSPESAYRRQLKVIRQAYDVILIDTKGEYTPFQYDLLTRSDYVMIPMHANETDYKAAKIITDAVEEENQQREDHEQIGISYLVSKADPDDSLHQVYSDKLAEDGHLLPYIREATSIAALLPTGMTPYEAEAYPTKLQKLVNERRKAEDKKTTITRSTMAEFTERLDAIADQLIERIAL